MPEEQKNYSIRVIVDINDPELVKHWIRIQEETDCFPQMYYEWCEPWWRLQSGKRELHIVTVEDGNNKILGIAPMCITKHFGLRILRSFPIHFGDFYHFLINKGPEKHNILNTIVGYLNSFKTWQVVHLFNVNDKSTTWKVMDIGGFKSKPLTNILIADFTHLSFEGYMKTLSRNTRQQWGKQFRQLERTGNVTLECIEKASGYVEYVHDMKNLYQSRWASDHTLPPDEIYYQCRNEAVQALFEKNKMALYVLKCDDKVIAFRLGFMHNQAFYDWKVSHNPNMDRYSPGKLIIGKIIEQLISREYKQLNFMTGDYSYKRSWATDGKQSTNYELLSSSSSLYAKLFVKYRIELRDKFRQAHQLLLEIGWVRTLKRWTHKQVRQIKS